MSNQNISPYNEFHDLNSTISTKWIVITGSPSSGKTTLIRELSNMGYAVLDDVAREIIQEMQRNLKPIDENKKQQLIVERLLKKYSTISRKKLVFLDYGMPDNLVFQAMAGRLVNTAVKASISFRYRAVFLLNPLAIENDGIRNLDYRTQHCIHRKILKKYKELNYNPIIIPATDLQSRLDIILKYLSESI